MHPELRAVPWEHYSHPLRKYRGQTHRSPKYVRQRWYS
jgi:hypothetical protein